MYISTNEETCQKIGEILDEQSDKPQNIRVFIAGMACSGPNFGLGLDNQTDSDYAEELFGVNFILSKDIFESMGEIGVEWAGTGFAVKPVKPVPSACSSCSICG